MSQCSHQSSINRLWEQELNLCPEGPIADERLTEHLRLHSVVVGTERGIDGLRA